MASTFWKNMPADPLWKLAVKVLMVAIAVNAFVIFAYYLSVAPVGTSFLIGLANFTILLFLAAILAIPAALVLLLFQKYRKYSVRLLIAALICTADSGRDAYCVRGSPGRFCPAGTAQPSAGNGDPSI
jgi:hypothetical protein